MKTKTQEKWLWGGTMLLALVVCYFIIRYFSLRLHGNTEWNIIMAVMAGILLLVFTFILRKELMILTVLAYPFAFLIGTLFGQEPRYIEIDGYTYGAPSWGW